MLATVEYPNVWWKVLFLPLCQKHCRQGWRSNKSGSFVQGKNTTIYMFYPFLMTTAVYIGNLCVSPLASISGYDFEMQGEYYAIVL